MRILSYNLNNQFQKMLPFQIRLKAFKALGKEMAHLNSIEKDLHSKRACELNTWFSESSITQMFEQVILNLSSDQLDQWVKDYSFVKRISRKIGVVSAGNIPLSSFQDWVCVLMSGHSLALKTSQRDTYLIKYLTDKLLRIEPGFKSYIIFTDELKGCDVFITSSSNNTARYFEYYFGNYPHIIRRQRASCTVLNGTENGTQLKALAQDMFLYFGLGCRSISKIFLPKNLDLQELLIHWQEQSEMLLDNYKYRHNYDYNKALFLVNGVSHLDNGYVLFKSDSKLASPIGVIHYSYYDDLEILKSELKHKQTELQCLVSSIPIEGFKCVDFGKAQLPNVWDYPDNIDTLTFLLKIN